MVTMQTCKKTGNRKQRWGGDGKQTKKAVVATVHGLFEEGPSAVLRGELR